MVSIPAIKNADWGTVQMALFYPHELLCMGKMRIKHGDSGDTVPSCFRPFAASPDDSRHSSTPSPALGEKHRGQRNPGAALKTDRWFQPYTLQGNLATLHFWSLIVTHCITLVCIVWTWFGDCSLTVNSTKQKASISISETNHVFGSKMLQAYKQKRMHRQPTPIRATHIFQRVSQRVSRRVCSF